MVLREGGEGALTIDRLCRDLGRTKGAFYHHFADVHVYADALLAAWEARAMQPAGHTPVKKSLVTRGGRREAHGSVDPLLDRSIRAWGLRDPRAREFVSRVDEQRIAQLAASYPPSVSLSARRKLSKLEYAASVGLKQLYPDLPHPAMRELEQSLRDALRRVAGATRRSGQGRAI
ncbi:MAG: hypothetical protein R3B48_13160 [Kofleriaceae bacterium]